MKLYLTTNINRMNGGGIYFDDNDQLVRKTKGREIITIPESSKKKASKLDKEDLLFPEDDEFMEILPAEKPKKNKKDRSPRESHSRAVVEIPQDLLDEFEEIKSAFDPKRSNKKQFREFRKIIAEVCNVRYPKKKKEKKSKKKR